MAHPVDFTTLSALSQIKINTEHRRCEIYSHMFQSDLDPLFSKTAFTRCRHILKTVKNSTDRPPVHTKTAHFLPADFENGRF